MRELVTYGLTGLAAMVVMVSRRAYGSQFYLQGKRSINLTDKALGLFTRRSGERSTCTIYRFVPSKSVPGGAPHG